MKKFVHIAFGDSAAKLLKNSMKWHSDSEFSDEIFCFKDNIDEYGLSNAISIEDSIVIWHGENPQDQRGLRYLCNKFADSDIYEVDIAKFKIEFENEEDYVPKSVEECNPEHIEELFLRIEAISLENRKILSSEWKEN